MVLNPEKEQDRAGTEVLEHLNKVSACGTIESLPVNSSELRDNWAEIRFSQ
jgi:hypothetical protein